MSASRYYYEATRAKTHLFKSDGKIDVTENGLRLVAQMPATTACGRTIGGDSDQVPKRRVTTSYADVDCMLCRKKLPATAWEKLA